MAEFLWVAVDAIALVAIIVAMVRVVGLRSFSKMAAYDFAITVAMGSILASVVLDADVSFVTGGLAVAALLALQWVIALARRRSPVFSRAVDNTPLLVMRDGEMLHDNLKAARLSESDLVAKLREANVLNFSEVRAVVFESTGDISVLHGPSDGPSLEERMLDGVRMTA